MFFEDFKIFRTLAFLGSPHSQCVHTLAGQKPALQQNLQSSEKSKHFKENKTIFNEHPVPADVNPRVLQPSIREE